MPRAQSLREEQIRRTLKDTQKKQNRMLRWVQLLIKHKGIIPSQQRETYLCALQDTTLLEGRGLTVVHKVKETNTRLNMGKFFDFAQAMAFQISPTVKIKQGNYIYQIPII